MATPDLGNHFMVTVDLEGAHPRHPDYPLIAEDVLIRQPDGTFTKVAPGLGVMGFRLSEAQQATLRPLRPEV